MRQLVPQHGQVGTRLFAVSPSIFAFLEQLPGPRTSTRAQIWIAFAMEKSCTFRFVRCIDET